MNWLQGSKVYCPIVWFEKMSLVRGTVQKTVPLVPRMGQVFTGYFAGFGVFICVEVIKHKSTSVMRRGGTLIASLIKNLCQVMRASGTIGTTVISFTTCELPGAHFPLINH